MALPPARILDDGSRRRRYRTGTNKDPELEKLRDLLRRSGYHGMTSQTGGKTMAKGNNSRKKETKKPKKDKSKK
jgi:hypothetical protein